MEKPDEGTLTHTHQLGVKGRCRESNALTQECLDGVQRLLVGHHLGDDGQLAALAVLEGPAAGRLRSEAYRLAAARQKREG